MLSHAHNKVEESKLEARNLNGKSAEATITDRHHRQYQDGVNHPQRVQWKKPHASGAATAGSNSAAGCACPWYVVCLS